MGVKLMEKYTKGFIREEEIEAMEPMVVAAHRILTEKTGSGSDYLGWLDLPTEYDKEEFERIKKAAEKIRNTCDVLVVIGIGGSYLGARAVIDFLKSPNYNDLNDTAPDIYYAGNQISASAMLELLAICHDRDVCINVISKSGTTTEPAVAFRVFRNLLEKKYGPEGARERIFVTTDKEKGTLKKFSDEKGYETFVVPDDVGGRYSVLTAVGLLPIAVVGISIDELMAGAAETQKECDNPNLKENPCYRYAAIRNILYNKGKTTEILVQYEPYGLMFNEWWKQLYGESEGKDGKGIYPASVIFSTDLHSLGQFIQDGRRNLFETVISVETPDVTFPIPEDKENVDGLNFLAGVDINTVKKTAMEGTILAHVDGGVPNLLIEIEDRSARSLGQLIYFFEKACGISGYLLGVNPFNQPGVEEYKKNMFALLGKPGYEELKGELEERLNK